MIIPGFPQVATTAKTGLVKPDGTTLLIAGDGTASVPLGSLSQAGLLQLGTGSGQAMPGNQAAGGDLTGTYPNPTIDLTKAHIYTANQTAPALIASGLTGAVAVSRHVGGTASGAPASGTFAIGDFVIDQTGTIYVCTAAGTPGTWVKVKGAAHATSDHYPGGPDDIYKWNGNLGNQATATPNGRLFIYPYDLAQVQTTIATGQMWVSEFTPESAFIVKQLFFYCSTAVVVGGGSVTVGQLALFSVSGTTYTLIQASTNDTALFNATGPVGKSITTTTLTPGSRYAVGILGVYSGITTTPQALHMAGAVTGQYNNANASGLVNLCATSAGSQTVMATFTASGTATRRFWFMLGN